MCMRVLLNVYATPFPFIHGNGNPKKSYHITYDCYERGETRSGKKNACMLIRDKTHTHSHTYAQITVPLCRVVKFSPVSLRTYVRRMCAFTKHSWRYYGFAFVHSLTRSVLTSARM